MAAAIAPQAANASTSLLSAKRLPPPPKVAGGHAGLYDVRSFRRTGWPGAASCGRTGKPGAASSFLIVGDMLRGIRNASSNWLGKTIMTVVMAVLIISFAVWGIADIFKGFGQSTLASIGRTEISIEQFRQTYNERLQQFGRQLGRALTPEQARALGIDRQILQQTIAEAVLDEAARARGLGLSDAARAT